MSDSGRELGLGYFIDEAGAAAFTSAFTRMLAEQAKLAVSQYTSDENTMRLRHGGEWQHPGAPEAVGTGMQPHSAVIATDFKELVDHDLGAIDRAAKQLVDSLGKQFAQMVYSTVAASCDQTGNVVDAKASGSLTEAFLKGIEKVEFSVDRNGQVRLPEVHLHPTAFAHMKAALETAPPEFAARMEAIKASKTADALKREEERKAKFVRYGEDG